MAQGKSRKPTVISTFAGCGGSSLGYKWAGFRELLAIEWDRHAAETFRLNFPRVPVWERDIVGIKPAEVLRFCKIKKGELDVLDGSPPCQGFSTAGKMNVNDKRNYLFASFLTLIEGLRPRVFVMENVPGMARGSMIGMFKEITLCLKATGYEVRCRQMNAMWYGVPQSRERLIWVGAREGEPRFPKPTPHVITLMEALRDVKNSQQEIAESKYPDGTMSTKLLKQMKMGEGGHEYHPKAAMFSLRRLHWFRPSRTVLRQDGGGASCSCCHPTELRRLTIPEIKKVCSFPKDFKLCGAYKDQWARLGNAVMPKFMEAIARTIRKEILQR